MLWVVARVFQVVVRALLGGWVVAREILGGCKSLLGGC